MKPAYIAFAAALLLAGCRTTRDRIEHRAYYDPRPIVPTTEAVAPPVAPAAATPAAFAPLSDYKRGGRPGLVARIFGRDASTGQAKPEPPALPRKCKGCTFNVVGGDQTNSTAAKKAAAGPAASVRGDTKAKGGAVVSQDSSTTNAVTGGGNLAATQGDGNTTSQTKQDTTQEAPGVGATLAGAIATPVGKVAGLALVLLLGYGVYRLWPLLRRRKPEEPITNLPA